MSFCFSENFKQLRKNQDLTQEQIADISMCHRKLSADGKQAQIIPMWKCCRILLFSSTSLLTNCLEPKKYETGKKSNPLCVHLNTLILQNFIAKQVT